MNTDAMCALRGIVGRSLRQHREKAGYTVGDAARILDCDASKISRMETGHRGIRARDLRELLSEYGAEPELADALVPLTRPRSSAGWWNWHEQAELPAPYLDLVSAEAVAAQMAVWGPSQVPGLLQAEQYMRAVAAADPSVPQECEDAVVAAALDRQRVVLSEQKSPLDVVIGEAALRQRTGGPTAMRIQLCHLSDLAESNPNVTIRLLPFVAGASPAGGAGGFTVLRFGALADIGLVHLDGPRGGACLSAPEAAGDYLRVLGRLQAVALNPERTIRRFQALIRIL